MHDIPASEKHRGVESTLASTGINLLCFVHTSAQLTYYRVAEHAVLSCRRWTALFEDIQGAA